METAPSTTSAKLQQLLQAKREKAKLLEAQSAIRKQGEELEGRGGVENGKKKKAKKNEEEEDKEAAAAEQDAMKLQAWVDADLKNEKVAAMGPSDGYLASSLWSHEVVMVGATASSFDWTMLHPDKLPAFRSQQQPLPAEMLDMLMNRACAIKENSQENQLAFLGLISLFPNSTNSEPMFGQLTEPKEELAENAMIKQWHVVGKMQDPCAHVIAACTKIPSSWKVPSTTLHQILGVFAPSPEKGLVRAPLTYSETYKPGMRRMLLTLGQLAPWMEDPIQVVSHLLVFSLRQECRIVSELLHETLAYILTIHSSCFNQQHNIQTIANTVNERVFPHTREPLDVTALPVFCLLLNTIDGIAKVSDVAMKLCNVLFDTIMMTVISPREQLYDAENDLVSVATILYESVAAHRASYGVGGVFVKLTPERYNSWYFQAKILDACVANHFLRDGGNSPETQVQLSKVVELLKRTAGSLVQSKMMVSWMLLDEYLRLLKDGYETNCKRIVEVNKVQTSLDSFLVAKTTTTSSSTTTTT